MVYFTTNLSEVTARPSILLSGDQWDDDDAVDRVPFSRPCQTPTTGIPIADSCGAYLSNFECWAISVDRAGYVRRHTRPLALVSIQPGHIHYLPCRTVAAMDKDHGDPVEVVRFTGNDGLC